MKNFEYIFQSGTHKWAILHVDSDRSEHIIDTNECLIMSEGEYLLTDPGGLEIFPSIFTSLTEQINPEEINQIFASHQDPDIISSYPMWLSINKNIKCHISSIWSTFITHFGGTMENIVPIPDEGKKITVGQVELELIPAHYLHSSGNFHLYDRTAKILFSGDVGAAIGKKAFDLFVNNFDEHIKYAEGFHKRWMGSVPARDLWCKRVGDLEVDLMVPQHGSIYRGEDVKRFINWFQNLDIGYFR